MSIGICQSQKKRRYTTKRLAIKVAIRSSQKRGVALRVYWHRECGSYHLTSSPRITLDINDRSKSA